MSGAGNSVGIATDYGLDGPGIEFWWGEIFRPFQTGPGAHPASCTKGTGSFPGVKYGRCMLFNTHPLLVPWSWKSRVLPLPTLWATTGLVTGTLYTLPLPLLFFLKRRKIFSRANCATRRFNVSCAYLQNFASKVFREMGLLGPA